MRLGRRRRRVWHEDRATLALALAAAGISAAVTAAQFGRVWRRGSAPLPQEADDVLAAAEEAAAETVETAVVGYKEGSARENAMFNLLGSFATSWMLARGITSLLRARATVGPFRDLKVGRRHIHHFVPGIVLAFGAGAAAIVTDNEEIESRLAIPFGVGMGLTFDESALLLELDDVYWSPEGILSVQITLSAISILGALALALRFLRRGEQVVLDGEPPDVSAAPLGAGRG
ncbi:MAG: hypothetical protein WD649_00880 [Thermoleophilaceae bacterium]